MKRVIGRFVVISKLVDVYIGTNDQEVKCRSSKARQKWRLRKCR